jgi:3-oxoadipate enol-lactonase
VSPDDDVPVVLLHPLGADAGFFDPLLPLLPGPVVAVDLPGHGSSPVGGRRTLPAVAEVVADILASWVPGPAIVLGVSLGGLVAQQLAVDAPHLVAGLVLVGAVPRYPAPLVEQWERRAEDLAQGRSRVPDHLAATEAGWFTASAPPQARARLARWLSDVPAQGYADACTVLATADTRDRLPSCRVPVLAACGEGDGPAFREALDWFGQLPTSAGTHLLPGRHATTFEFPDATAQLVDQLRRHPAATTHPAPRRTP